VSFSFNSRSATVISAFWLSQPISLRDEQSTLLLNNEVSQWLADYASQKEIIITYDLIADGTDRGKTVPYGRAMGSGS
jgi:hypothetical protein